MDAVIKLLYIPLALLVIYAFVCFCLHFLDFGWKCLSGKWFHEGLPLIKKIRSGIFPRLLIGFVLTILLYGGLRDLLGFIPTSWGRIDESGVLHPYNRQIASVLAVILAGIIMYSFNKADLFFQNQEQNQKSNEN